MTVVRIPSEETTATATPGGSQSRVDVGMIGSQVVWLELGQNL